MKPLITLLLLVFSFAVCAQDKEKYQKLVDSLLPKGETGQLISYFQKELKKKPKDENILRWLGYISIAANKADDAEKYYTEALKVNPSCSRCYVNLGRVYGLRENYKTALEYFDKAIAMDPTDAGAYNIRAKTKEALGDKFRALFDYNKAIELDPDNMEFYLDRANYNVNQGYLSLALTDADKAIELAPANYQPYQRKAEYLYNKGMLKDALSTMDKAIQLDSAVSDLYTGRGAIYSGLKDFEMAFKDYDKAIQLDPNSYVPYYNRYMDKYGMEDMDGSCKDLLICQQILKKNDPTGTLLKTIDQTVDDYCDSAKPGYYYQRGIALFNMEKFDQAIQVYSKGLKKFPGNTLILQFRGNACFAKASYEDALEDFYAAIANREKIAQDVKENPRFSSKEAMDEYIPGFIAATYLYIAESKFALQKYDEALTEINKGMESPEGMKGPGPEHFYNVRGNIYMALSQYEAALKDFEQSLNHNKVFSVAYVNKAIAKVNLADKVKISTYSIGGGFNNQPFNANWSLPLKTSSKKTDGNLVSALEDCNKAISIEPNLAYAFYIRGQIKRMLAYGDYCYDILKAKNLGFVIEPELLRECTK